MNNYGGYNGPYNGPYNNVNTTKKQKKNMSAWKYEDRSVVPLCKGVEISESVYEISENRYHTLILKGLIVYFITAGGIGSYLTALNIDFNQILFNLFILGTAILCAVLYHSWKSENLGYLAFFSVYAGFIIFLKDYLNSGFYAIMNSTIDWASIYFDTEGLQTYNERISNRYVTVTVAAIIIGIAMNILLNNYILRRARYMIAIGLALGVNVIAFYMEIEPDTIYSIMVLAGILMTYVLKSGRHFHLSRRDHVFQRSKKGLTYALDFKSLWQGMAMIGLVVLLIVGSMSTIYNKVYYDSERQPSETKEASREMFQNFIMLGFMGLFNFYPNNGGLSTGELGGVSSIRLDYKTDLTVTFTPYSNDMLYIRNFVGDIYKPYDNVWVSAQENYMKDSGYDIEVNSLKKAYEEGDEYTARGYMAITNVEAPTLCYQPYYSEGDRKPVYMGQTKSYTYYPLYYDSKTKITEYEPDSVYLKVPKDNRKVIKKFIEDAHIDSDDPQEIVSQISNYFQQNVPYTVRPGATPWNEDFVNYFLTENKKGYCAHFASAATLILRAKGIPARYCEGYAISFTQVLDSGELLSGEAYESYFDGYNSLGQTGLVSVNATDADAHAWVEIFDKDRGWVEIEVTPSAGLDEAEEDESFWDSFNSMFGDGDEDGSENETSNTDRFSLSGADRVMRYIAFAVMVLTGLGLILFGLRKLWPYIKYKIEYSKAGISDKLILKYTRYIKKKKKKEKLLRDKMNYTDQLRFLMAGDAAGREKLGDILERAGFSDKEISSQEFEYADQQIENIFSKKK